MIAHLKAAVLWLGLGVIGFFGALAGWTLYADHLTLKEVVQIIQRAQQAAR